MITFVPVGGLANRMRAINAAIELARDVQDELRIIWYKDWGLNCRFDQLFLPIDAPGVTLKEAAPMDLISLDRPRKKNLYVPRLFHRICFDDAIYEDEVTQRYFKQFDFREWSRGRNVYLASCIYFYGKEENPYSGFVPLPVLQDQIERVATAFDEHTIGIHIRRTDHTEAVSGSPTDLFIERMQAEIEKENQTKFYLATDSEEDKESLRKVFGERIITSPREADRGSLQGMEDALIELYTLSKASRIIGSFRSTYSEAAALIGKIPCEVMIKQQP